MSKSERVYRTFIRGVAFVVAGGAPPRPHRRGAVMFDRLRFHPHLPPFRGVS